VAPGPGPTHGQHTDAVLAELGYGEGEIAHLRKAGAVA
jgi:crotonobetainyl-CoA:carnitine CoA-transferase CaiB-like acyl-CoA transferase